MTFSVDQTKARLTFALVATWHVQAVRVWTAFVERIVFAFVNVCMEQVHERYQGKAFTTIKHSN